MPKLRIRFTTHNFHKFWCLQVLQDISMEYMPKYAIKKGAKHIWAKRTQGSPSRSKTRPSTSVVEAQTHLGAHLAKAVRGGATQGAGTPPCHLLGPPFGRRCIECPQ